MRSFRLVVPWLVFALSCAGLRDGVYVEGHTRFRIGALPASWREVHLSGNDVAFVSADATDSLAINATCVDHDDPSLEVLTRHLLMGFSGREIVSQALEPLDGREALRTHVRALLDGVPVELILVVMKKDGCVYDFTWVGRPDASESVFEQVLTHFHAGPTS
jgi:hypothetical protein